LHKKLELKCHDSDFVREPGNFNEVEYHEDADIDQNLQVSGDLADEDIASSVSDNLTKEEGDEQNSCSKSTGKFSPFECGALVHPHKRKVTQASTPMGGPIQGSDVQDQVEPYVKDDAVTPKSPGTLSGNHLR
jgi:hypothetical protein